MLKRLRKILFSVLLGLILSVPSTFAQTYGKVWQEIGTVSSYYRPVFSQDDIDVFSGSNLIILKTNRETDVRIFTILGKLISSQRIGPGTFEFRPDAKGIYIIKTEEISCKVAIS